MLNTILDTIRDRIYGKLENFTEEYHESCSLLGYSKWEKISFRFRSGFWWHLGKLI